MGYIVIFVQNESRDGHFFFAVVEINFFNDQFISYEKKIAKFENLSYRTRNELRMYEKKFLKTKN